MLVPEVLEFRVADMLGKLASPFFGWHYSKSAPVLCPKVASYTGVANNFFLASRVGVMMDEKVTRFSQKSV